MPYNVIHDSVSLCIVNNINSNNALHDIFVPVETPYLTPFEVFKAFLRQTKPMWSHFIKKFISLHSVFRLS